MRERPPGRNEKSRRANAGSPKNNFTRLTPCNVRRDSSGVKRGTRRPDPSHAAVSQAELGAAAAEAREAGAVGLQFLKSADLLEKLARARRLQRILAAEAAGRAA